MTLSTFGQWKAPSTYQWESISDPSNAFGGGWLHNDGQTRVAADAFKNYSDSAIEGWNSPLPNTPQFTSSASGLGGALTTPKGPPKQTSGSSGPGLGGSFQLPQGFDVGQGSNDPAVNHQVYGTNYFPSNDPRFQSILRRTMGWGDEQRPPIDQAAFLAMDPSSQALYRNALYEWYQGGQGAGGGSGTLPPSGGASMPTPSTQPPSMPTQPGGNQEPLPDKYKKNYFPDDPQSRFDNGLGIPHTSIDPDTVMEDPGYKWQLEKLDRELEDMFAAKGRVGSTDYFNTKAGQHADLLSREYNRINNQQWDRGMEMNRLLYDRRVQEDYSAYEREFRENERKYGRERAEEILKYDRQWKEEAREYDRYRYLVELGLGATNASSGT